MDQVSEMFALIEDVRKELARLINQLTPEEKARQGSLREWSAKDLLTHLAFWGSHFNRQLEQMLAGQKPPVAGDYYDQVNDGVLYEHLEQPFEEARAEEEAAYQQFRQIAAGIPPADLLDSQKFTFLEGHALLERILGTYTYHVAAHISDYYKKNRQLEKARELQETLAKRLYAFPDSKANAVYNLACFYSLNGFKDEAIAKLKESFALKPELIDWSKQDSDIDPLREMAEYRELAGE